MRTSLFFAVVMAFAFGCAARQPVTTWGYSHWYQRDGAGSMGVFEQHQKACLEQVGVAGDAPGVAPESREENEFVECMNAAGWCTEQFECSKPGA